MRKDLLDAALVPPFPVKGTVLSHEFPILPVDTGDWGGARLALLLPYEPAALRELFELPY
jgi:hypothetical protein